MAKAGWDEKPQAEAARERLASHAERLRAEAEDAARVSKQADEIEREKRDADDTVTQDKRKADNALQLSQRLAQLEADEKERRESKERLKMYNEEQAVKNAEVDAARAKERGAENQARQQRQEAREKAQSAREDEERAQLAREMAELDGMEEHKRTEELERQKREKEEEERREKEVKRQQEQAQLERQQKAEKQQLEYEQRKQLEIDAKIQKQLEIFEHEAKIVAQREEARRAEEPTRKNGASFGGSEPKSPPSAPSEKSEADVAPRGSSTASAVTSGPVQGGLPEDAPAAEAAAAAEALKSPVPYKNRHTSGWPLPGVQQGLEKTAPDAYDSNTLCWPEGHPSYRPKSPGCPAAKSLDGALLQRGF